MEDRKHQSDDEKQDLFARWAGLSAEQLFDKSLVTKLEVSLESLGEMKVLSEFENLRSLSLVALDIQEIEGLNSMLNLRDLWLNQNTIREISGLDFALQLRKLDLSCNQISLIAGLDSCSQLEVLNLNENLLENLHGLKKLPLLTELHVARNRISYIGNCLNPLKCLVSLNIAGNLIGSFKEILNLTCLETLKTLLFNDPHFLENPVCNLSNYQTYALFHLPQLESLDGYVLTDETKNHAESTFMKKKMYYNMRIKTIKRTASQVRTTIRNLACEYEKRVLVSLKPLEMMLKSAEKELRTGLSLSVGELEERTEMIRENLRAEYKYLQHLDKTKYHLSEKIEDKCKDNIGRLVIELETGGNIRYEEGKPTDNWYMSCAELVLSRYQSYTNIKLQVTRVSRIHNKFLRNRFEDKLESLVDLVDPTYKQNLEYLFYSADMHDPEILSRVVEEGFRTPDEYTSMGLVGAIPLVNSVQTADLHRTAGFSSDIDKVFQLSGKLLLCKVYTGKITEYPETFFAHQSVQEVWWERPFSPPTEGWVITRSRRHDSNQKIWFVFDHALVLPEYLVEYEYCDKEGSMDTFDPEVDRAELSSLNLSLNAFIEICKQHSVSQAAKMPQPTDEKVEELTEENLMRFTKSGDFNSVETLDLSINALKNLNKIRNLPNLSQLYVSFNCLKSLTDLVICSNLHTLDISYNYISSLEPLSLLKNLDYINVSNNQIQDIREIFHLKSNTALSNLTMLGNPISAYARYREIVTMNLPSLRELDMSQISAEEKKKLSSTNPRITLEIARSVAAVRTVPSGLLSAGEFSVHKAPISLIGKDWASEVEILNLHNQKLLSLEGVEQFPGLKKASFVGNFIQNISAIDKCQQLEELSLENNLISNIQNLSSLRQLTKLDLGKNSIRKLDGLEGLELLTQLSLEDNFIESLRGIEDLSTLMELYICNNQLANCKEIALLKSLPKLIILDLSNNPMTKEKNFRLYVVFHLKKLKVLDGVSVEQSEHTSAKGAFGGRITEEVLEERLCGMTASTVVQLDLSGIKLRSFDNAINSRVFPMLIHLNLSNNHLQNLICFGSFPQLITLNLSANKIDSLVTPENRGLCVMPGLQTLDMSYNSLQVLNGLQAAPLRGLHVLILSHNQLTRLDISDNIPLLKELDVSNNLIKQLDSGSFVNPLNLKFLKLDDNRIRNLSYFNRLAKLQCLQLMNNRIHEMNEVDKLRELPTLVELILTNNPICKKQPYRMNIIKKLPMLMYLDSVEVTPEERGDHIQEKAPPLVQVIQQSRVPVKLASVNFEPGISKPDGGKRPPTRETLGAVIGISSKVKSYKPRK